MKWEKHTDKFDFLHSRLVSFYPKTLSLAFLLLLVPLAGAEPAGLYNHHYLQVENAYSNKATGEVTLNYLSMDNDVAVAVGIAVYYAKDSWVETGVTCGLSYLGYMEKPTFYVAEVKDHQLVKAWFGEYDYGSQKLLGIDVIENAVYVVHTDNSWYEFCKLEHSDLLTTSKFVEIVTWFDDEPSTVIAYELS